MSVLDRADLEASPLADLHAIAAELEIEGYRRIRKDELIEAILSVQGGGEASAPADDDAPADPDSDDEVDEAVDEEFDEGEAEDEPAVDEDDDWEDPEGDEPSGPADDVRAGTLDILPNGSGFMRSNPYAHNPDDVYVSAAQIRRCELRSGDELSGPVRPPRRSERYPSLVRIETVNGAEAEPPAERPEFSDLTPVFPSVPLEAPALFSAAPIGKGSRVAIAGEPGAGATTLLREVARTLAESHPEIELTVVLAGVRPEELAEWADVVEAPIAGGSFERPPEEQGQVAALAIERAQRVAERGGDAALLVDALDRLPAAAARRVFAGARSAAEGGSVTVVAVASDPDLLRVATTRITLEHSAAGGEPRAGTASGTVRGELLT